MTEVQLPESIVCNSTLWAACIGGAAQQDNYRRMIEAAGLRLVKVRDNPQYQFISDNAKGASRKFGVKSISLLAVALTGEQQVRELLSSYWTSISEQLWRQGYIARKKARAASIAYLLSRSATKTERPRE